MLEPNRRELVGKTLMDYSKIVLAAGFASGFFAAFPPKFRLGALLIFVILFFAGWACIPSGKGEK